MNVDANKRYCDDRLLFFHHFKVQGCLYYKMFLDSRHCCIKKPFHMLPGQKYIKATSRSLSNPPLTGLCGFTFLCSNPWLCTEQALSPQALLRDRPLWVLSTSNVTRGFVDPILQGFSIMTCSAIVLIHVYLCFSAALTSASPFWPLLMFICALFVFWAVTNTFST